MPFFILIISLLASSMSIADDCPLTGTWQSNKEKTLPELMKSQLSDTVKTNISGILGKMVIEYKDCKTATAKFMGKTTPLQFELIKKSDTIMTIKDPLSGKETHLEIVDDCYIIQAQKLFYKEYYCRVK